ncbi:S8 family peptidase [Cohnella sp. GCM10027633]|uniref:S8 family peptidase n=1 Tax=unclassified Cohnella TaxID=2636738 RepID=UPI00362C7798
MNGLAARLRACARRKPSANTVRTIIGFKRRHDYRRCRRHLAAIGVHPVKQSRAMHMLTYHADPRRDRKLLQGHPRIAFVERDFKAKAHPIRRGKGARAIVPWNVRRVLAPRAWISARQGKCVRIAVIDTGIAEHPDLRIAGGVNTIGGLSFADDNGHGTHVAGIAAATGKHKLYGTAPRVKLYAVKVLDANGEGYVSDIVQGIEWCLARGIRVMNMSLGLGADSKALRTAVRRARRKGAIIVASAGNDGPSNRAIDYPARYPQTIAVAATDRRDKIASFSSRGGGIDVAAPGVDIWSTFLDGGYAYGSGTSMSSPHVTGGAALLKAIRPRSSPCDVIRAMKASAKPVGNRRIAGCGLLRIAMAARIARKPR